MKNLTIFVALAMLLLQNIVSKTRRPEDAFSELPKFKSEPKIIEFLDDIGDEPYLEDLTFDDRFVLDLYRFEKQLKDKAFKIDHNTNFFCNYDILMAMGLKGYANPIWKTDDIVDCPDMTFNCCSPIELTNLDEIWKKFSKYIEMHHFYYTYYIKAILSHHNDYLEIVDEVRENSKYRVCGKAATLLKQMEMDDKTLAEADRLIKKAQSFDLRMKKGFKCLLCDFDNAKHIDKEERYVKFHSNVCLDMVRQNFEYYNYFNTYIWKYINTVNLLAHCVNHADQKDANHFVMNNDKKFDFISVDNSLYIEGCKMALTTKDVTEEEIFQSCLNFCYRFSLFDYSTNIFKDIELMGRIFKNVKTHLIKSELLEVSDPAKELSKFKFEFFKPELNIFAYFQYIYDLDGIDKGRFIMTE